MVTVYTYCTHYEFRCWRDVFRAFGRTIVGDVLEQADRVLIEVVKGRVHVVLS